MTKIASNQDARALAFADTRADAPNPPAPVEAAPSTIGIGELERLTGVGAERIRTWERRFGFPEQLYRANAARRYAVSDVPRVLAARQLIDLGEPVASAMATVKAGRTPADLTVLERSFGALAAPVTAWQGPEPLELLWANEAARQSARGPIATPDRSRAAFRALQRVMVPVGGTAVTLEHPSLCPPTDEVRRLLVWGVGPPAFTPAIAVVMELPASEQGDSAPPEPSSSLCGGLDPRWPAAVGRARRALQRSSGPEALSDALACLLEGTGACDAVLLHPQGGELVAAQWSRGRRPTPSLAGSAAREFRRATELMRPMWLSAGAAELLAGPEHGGACLAVPLVISGCCRGYVVLEFPQRVELPGPAEELLLMLGSAFGASMGRDRAATIRRRTAGLAAA